MKKILRIFTLVVIFTLAISSVAAAKTGVGNPKGTIESFDEVEGTVTLLLDDDSLEEDSYLVVTLPADFDFENTTLEVGMYVVAKGEWTEEGFTADIVQEADEEEEEVEEPEETEEETEDGEGEGNAWGQGGVYCNDGKENPHPVAQKIADKYGVDPEWVMSYKCDGYGFGAVMLALQTAEANQGEEPNEGEDANEGEEVNGHLAKAEEYLAKRKEGKGWGQIWKEDGLVEDEEADSPPPGQLKKPDKAKGPDKEKGPDKDKQPKKEKPPKTNNGKSPKNKTPEDDSDGD